MTIRSMLSLFAGCAACVLSAAESVRAQSAAGWVFTTTNEAPVNRLAFFPRGADGQLGHMLKALTGGSGVNGPLGNQGAIAFGGPKAGFIYAVNAGSNTISTFVITDAGPVLVGTVPSGGTRPISVATRFRTLYVLHESSVEGEIDHIVGFKILSPTWLPVQMAGSARRLSGPSVDPAQIGFSQNGGALLVTEKATSLITAYTLDSFGRAGRPMPQTSEGKVPFGFTINPFGHLLVAESFEGVPNASAVSSYFVEDDGRLRVLDPVVRTNQTEASWIATTANGLLTYTTNTGSNTISGYDVDPQTGDLDLLSSSGTPVGLVGAPTDAATLGNRLLYVLNSGTGEVIGYRIAPGGALKEITRMAGLPANPTGLLAR